MGKRVVIAGLEKDYQAIPFGPMPELLVDAEFVTKVNDTMVCNVEIQITLVKEYLVRKIKLLLERLINMKHVAESALNYKGEVMDRFIGILGIIAILGIAYLMSNNKKNIDIRLVVWGLGLQLLFGIFHSYPPFGKPIFKWFDSLIKNY